MKLTSVVFILYFVALISATQNRCPDNCNECDGPFGNQCIECNVGHYAENGICRTCHYSCKRCNGPLKSDCLPESLYMILNTHRSLSSGDVSVPSSNANLQSGYDLYYEFNNDGTIDILINNTAGQGWFAIGLGTVMVGADMIVCFPSGSTVTCSDYLGQNHVTPTLATQYTTVVGYDISSSALIVKVNRKLDTGDSTHRVIQVGPNDMVWAFQATSTVFIQHSTMGSAIVTLCTGGISCGVVITTLSQSIEVIHGLIIFFGWGLAVDIGLLFMAIGRKYPFYIMIHSLAMWYTTISTIVVESLIIKDRASVPRDPVLNAHFGIGIAILVLMILQHIGGIAVLSVSKGKKPKSSFYRMRLGHRTTGILIYILAKINIFIGVNLHNTGEWYPWIIPIEATLMALNILVRIWMKYRNTVYHPLVSKVNHKTTAQQQKLVAAVNEGKTREELLTEFPKMKFGYLFNRIYDLSSFEHPGGTFIISAITGREIGRFLYGAYHLEEIKSKRFKHGTNDIAILNKYFIGDIIQDEKSILVDVQSGKPAVTNDFIPWKFIIKKPLTKSTACFEFQNQSYQIKNDLKGVSWMGRHFYLSKGDLVRGPTRPYTVCNSLGESWTAYRKAVIEFFERKIQSEENTALSATLPTLSNNLNFVIKQYHNPKSTPLSGYLHNSLTDSSNILINGPVGQGLEIKDNAKGTHYAFAVGTGVLPFIDLLNFILFKSMYLALKQKFGQSVAQQIGFQGADYENTLSERFKLVLFVAYADNDDAIGFDIIKKAAEINSKFNLGLFEAHVKGVTDDQHIQKISSRIDHAFVKEKVSKDATKILICGSPSFNQVLPDTLKKVGIDAKKIVLV